MWTTYLVYVLDDERFGRVFDVVDGDPYLLNVLAAVLLAGVVVGATVEPHRLRGDGWWALLGIPAMAYIATGALFYLGFGVAVVAVGGAGGLLFYMLYGILVPVLYVAVSAVFLPVGVAASAIGLWCGARYLAPRMPEAVTRLPDGRRATDDGST